jgi:hypothetical protein
MHFTLLIINQQEKKPKHFNSKSILVSQDQNQNVETLLMYTTFVRPLKYRGSAVSVALQYWNRRSKIPKVDNVRGE